MGTGFRLAHVALCLSSSIETEWLNDVRNGAHILP